jgi:hypothetical protein
MIATDLFLFLANVGLFAGFPHEGDARRGLEPYDGKLSRTGS